MGITLFSHNRSAYFSALAMMRETGKAAIIHPTGTGKSFIGFKLAEDHKDDTVLWISPSEYIMKTQVENLKRESGTVLDNITFITYARLMMMTPAQVKKLCPQFIIFDEFHRCGAAEWGGGVARLLETFPKVPILGLSATNIRYLDNQRNMADELFDGNVASEITLGEAIVKNILLPPTYVISVYAYQKELQKYEDRIDRISNAGLRAKKREELEALRRALEKADGLDAVFQKHMKNKAGKYLVFCSGREQLDEMRSHAQEWFGAIDPDMHLYSVYFRDPSASRDFSAFKKDSSEHLKLLFCIDMLNEGVHVEDIDGVILFRPTVSPIIYKQQIGRALSASKKKNPVIFDVVNNFSNLYSISSIQEEVQLAVSYYRDHGEEEKVIHESFHIIDETCDCKRIFERLENSLSSNWETYFRAAKEYFDKNGDLNIPKQYVTEEGLSLGMWIKTQRRVKNGAINGILTQGQIRRLDAIGMIWDNLLEVRWETGYLHAKEYYETHGNLNVKANDITADGFRLGAWIVYNRQWRKNNSHRAVLNENRIRKLDAIGMVWNQFNEAWEQNFKAAEAYFKEHGNLDVPSSFVSENSIKLGAWIQTLRKAYRGAAQNAALTQEQIERLNHIGMVWSGPFDLQWETAYQAAREYYEKNGHLKVPVNHQTDTGFALGKWIRRQRINQGLTKTRRTMLDAIGMVWEHDPWEERYELAKEFYQVYGHLRIPQDYKTGSNIWLGKWIYQQRKIYSGEITGEALSESQVERLNKIGMVWQSATELAWMKNYENAKAYFEEYGNLDVPKGYHAKDGSALGLWIRKQRRYRKEAKLKAQQQELLDKIGMIWGKEKDTRYAV